MGDTEDLTAGPLCDRLVHKKWNVRKLAYIELEKVFNHADEDNDPVFSKYRLFCCCWCWRCCY